MAGASFSQDAEYNAGGLSRTEILDLQSDAIQQKLVNLTSEKCLREFGGKYETSYDAVLLVVDTASTTTSLVQTGTSGTSLKSYIKTTKRDGIELDGSLVQYCLARAGSSETCSVTVSSFLLGLVALLNLIVFGAVLLLLSRSRFDPLATLGDAARSFLRTPDITTKDACLLSKADVKGGQWGYSDAKYFIPGTHFWLFTPSLPRWILFTFSWLSLTGPVAVVLGLVVPTDPEGITTSFGTATPYTTFVLPSQISTSQMALLACLPQLLLAILYLVTNSHLTTYYLSHEFTLFALGPQPLRVSSHRAGAQTTSLYLTLPRPVSWLLLALFVTMGFILSQAVFPVVITISPSTTDQSQILTVALSAQALLVLFALLFALMAMVIGLGLRRAPAAALENGQEKGNPLALRGGSCSAALSAKCQPAPGELEPWRQELTWGVISESMGTKHGRCALSVSGVGAVDVGRTYA